MTPDTTMGFVYAQVLTVASGIHCGVILLAYMTGLSGCLRYALPPLWLALSGSMTAAFYGPDAWFIVTIAAFSAATLVDQLYRKAPRTTLIMGSATGAGLALYFTLRTLIPTPQGVELAAFIGLFWAVSSGYLCFLTVKRGVTHE